MPSVMKGCPQRFCERLQSHGESRDTFLAPTNQPLQHYKGFLTLADERLHSTGNTANDHAAPGRIQYRCHDVQDESVSQSTECLAQRRRQTTGQQVRPLGRQDGERYPVGLRPLE